ncbi:MAG: c-type cytochrome [Gemmatimonadaceae bacterium]
MLDSARLKKLISSMRTVVLFALISALAASAAAQDTATASPGTLASKGVYTAGQAERGEKVYTKICVECHEPFEFAGSLWDKEWLGKTAFDFFDLVKTTMPDDKPGTLAREDIVDVLAYILRLNSYPAGQADIPNDDEKLKLIQFDARPAPPPPPARLRR